MKDLTLKILKRENENKLASDYDFKFMKTYIDPITSLYNIVDQFIKNSDLDVEDDDETIVYLTMCTLAISFKKDKNEYRKLFSELRMRNVYGLLEPMTEFMDFLVVYFNTLLKTKFNYDIFSLFSHPLLIPFLDSLSNIIKKEDVSLEDYKRISDLAEDHIKEFDKTTVKDFTNSFDVSKVDKTDAPEILKWSDWKKQNGLAGDVERIDEES